MKTPRLIQIIGVVLSLAWTLAPGGSYALLDADRHAVIDQTSNYIENDADCPVNGTTSSTSASGGSTIDYTDPARGNRKVTVSMYLPADNQPHPLLVFSPGRDQDGTPTGMYGRYLKSVAGEGFTVAGISFSDNHSAAVWTKDAQDVSFAINKLLVEPQLTGKILSSAGVGIFGHSDGGAVTMQVGYGSAQNSHVKAVLAASGANGGTNAGPPLLVMYGTNDFNSGGGQGSYDSVNPPYKALVKFIGATHTGYLTTDQGAASTKFNAAADSLTGAFFKRFLEGSDAGTDLKAIVAASYSDIATFSEAGTSTPAGSGGSSSSSSTGDATCCADSVTSGTGTLPASVPAPYNAIFTDAANKAGADPLLVATIFLTENGFAFPNPPPPYGTGANWPVSPVGAAGPFQFMPGTWPSYSDGGNVNDLKDAAAGGARFVLALGGKAGIPAGSLATAMTMKPSVANVLGSYNAGPAGNFNNNETIGYITKGLQIYQSLQGGGALNAVPAPTPTASACTDADSSVGSGTIADIIKYAENYAWPDFQNYRYTSKPSYDAAWKKYDGASNTTDCSAFVGTVMISSGADPNFPKAGTAADMTYVLAHPEKYDVIPSPSSTSQLKPGDLLLHDVGGSGHILIYIGDSHWQGADASLGSHTPQVSPNVTWMFSEPNDVIVRLK